MAEQTSARTVSFRDQPRSSHVTPPMQPSAKGEIRDIRERLNQAGLRPTRQRIALAALLFGSGDRHLTAEKLYEEARTCKHPPSLATVYNTLHQFAEHGLVREIALYGATIWYDTKVGPHFHFYLDDRDQLVDIPDELIPLVDIPAPPGMEIAGIDVVVRVKPTPKQG